MTQDQTTRDERVLRVRLAADAASVPGARRFVADGLRAWGHDELVDDASLCVSELAGNAALHANSTYIEVAVMDLDRVVRLLVEDDGPAPLEAISPRAMLPDIEESLEGLEGELDDIELLLNAPTTGRGLAIVSVLASDWGIEELEHGKRVWAELAAEPTDEHGPRQPHTTRDTVPDEPVIVSPEELPPGWLVVRLAGCPVDLSLHQDQHLDELVRELTLMSVDDENTESARLAHRLEAILRAPAQARAAGRRQAQAARDRGERIVDVEMAIPREFSPEVRRLNEAVTEADRLCEQQRLLTLASPQELRDFRSWMTEEITGQAERGTTPTTWDEWRASR